jgi:hypothetical protein
MTVCPPTAELGPRPPASPVHQARDEGEREAGEGSPRHEQRGQRYALDLWEGEQIAEVQVAEDD